MSEKTKIEYVRDPRDCVPSATMLPVTTASVFDVSATPFAVGWLKIAITHRSTKPSIPSQAYFWTVEWQKGEKEADEDIKAGRVKRFSSADDAIRYLRSL